MWNNTVNWRYFKVFQRYFYRHQNRSSTILYPPQKFEVHFLPLNFFSNTKKHRWIFFQVQKTPLNIFSSTKNTIQYFLKFKKYPSIFSQVQEIPFNIFSTFEVWSVGYSSPLSATLWWLSHFASSITTGEGGSKQSSQ